MIKGFRDFIVRGNVIDLAVAFVAGAAFTALVGSVSDTVINPFIGIFLGDGLDSGKFEIRGEVIDLGALVSAFITFFVTMVVLYFVFVAPMNAWRKHREEEHEEEPAGPTDTELLTEIRDLLRAQQTKD